MYHDLIVFLEFTDILVNFTDVNRNSPLGSKVVEIELTDPGFDFVSSEHNTSTINQLKNNYFNYLYVIRI